MRDADRKLGRAEHHRDDLAALLVEYRRRRPFRVDERTEESAGKPYRVVYAHDLEPAPDDAALIFGDVVQNLRASLDYLVGELRPGGPTQNSQFPICTTPASFKSASASQLAGVPGDIVAAIERMQAYGPAAKPAADIEDGLRETYRPLRYLNSLWSIDKHRALAVASGWMAPGWASHNRKGPETGIGYKVDVPNRRAEWWVPVDDQDPTFHAVFEVRVALRPPPVGYMADWPEVVTDHELDELAETLCWVVRWMVPRHLGQYRVP